MKLTNKLNLPTSIAHALSIDDYDYVKDAVSVTTLIDSPHIANLRRVHSDEIEEDISDRIWALVGSAIHHTIEKAGRERENVLTECRYTSEINGVNVTGKIDYFDKTLGELQDFKVTSVWSIIYGSRLAHWEKQVNCYAYLMRKAGIKVKTAKIIAILRDWNAKRAIIASYPKSQIHVYDLKLWPIAQQEKFILERLALHNGAISECTSEERWMNNAKWAVMKKGKKRAIKLFDDQKEANALLEKLNNDKEDHYVEYRPAVATRCESYCPVAKFCKFYQEQSNE